MVFSMTRVLFASTYTAKQLKTIYYSLIVIPDPYIILIFSSVARWGKCIIYIYNAIHKCQINFPFPWSVGHIDEYLPNNKQAK